MYKISIDSNGENVTAYKSDVQSFIDNFLKCALYDDTVSPADRNKAFPITIEISQVKVNHD